MLQPDVASDVDGGEPLNSVDVLGPESGLPSRLIRYLVYDTQGDANCIEASGKSRKWQAFDPLPVGVLSSHASETLRIL